MSYCRWSSDNFQCDVYVYNDVYGGICIHVAESKVKWAEPLPPKITNPEDLLGFLWRESEVGRILARSDYEKIGLPYDGHTFCCPEREDAIARLYELKSLGYRVPQRVIETLENEALKMRNPILYFIRIVWNMIKPRYKRADGWDSRGLENFQELE